MNCQSLLLRKKKKINKKKNKKCISRRLPSVRSIKLVKVYLTYSISLSLSVRNITFSFSQRNTFHCTTLCLRMKDIGVLSDCYQRGKMDTG